MSTRSSARSNSAAHQLGERRRARRRGRLPAAASASGQKRDPTTAASCTRPGRRRHRIQPCADHRLHRHRHSGATLEHRQHPHELEGEQRVAADVRSTWYRSRLAISVSSPPRAPRLRVRQRRELEPDVRCPAAAPVRVESKIPGGRSEHDDRRVGVVDDRATSSSRSTRSDQCRSSIVTTTLRSPAAHGTRAPLRRRPRRGAPARHRSTGVREDGETRAEPRALGRRRLERARRDRRARAQPLRDPVPRSHRRAREPPAPSGASAFASPYGGHAPESQRDGPGEPLAAVLGTSRLLPMPGSATTVTSCGPPVPGARATISSSMRARAPADQRCDRPLRRPSRSPSTLPDADRLRLPLGRERAPRSSVSKRSRIGAPRHLADHEHRRAARPTASGSRCSRRRRRPPRPPAGRRPSTPRPRPC